MSEISGPRFGFIFFLLMIALAIDIPGNPVRKLALDFLSAFASSLDGSGGFLR